MAFSTTEKINAADKLVLQISGLNNSPPSEKFWFNELFAWSPIIKPDKIWADFSSIPGADNSGDADANAIAFPTILEKRKLRLTKEPTSANRAFIAYSIFGDLTSAVYENWILPALIRTVNNDPSNGYSVLLYDGDPDLGGVLLPTTFLPGPGGEPSWQFNYSTGILLVSTDESVNYNTIYTGAGLWILGYRYIGAAGSGGSTSVLSTPVTQVAHGFDKDFIYYDGITLSWVKAQADSLDHGATHYAENIDVNTFRKILIGEVDVTTLLDDAANPIVPGDYYYLSQTVAGKVQIVHPTSGVAQSVLKANETNKASILIEEPYVSGAAANLNERTVTTTDTLLMNDDFVFLNSLTPTDFNLPDISTMLLKKVYYIKNIGAAPWTVKAFGFPGGDQIDWYDNVVMSTNSVLKLYPKFPDWKIVY